MRDRQGRCIKVAWLRQWRRSDFSAAETPSKGLRKAAGSWHGESLAGAAGLKVRPR
jgi:hypothetical protein